MMARFHSTPNAFPVRGVTESGNAASPPPHNSSASPFCTGVSDFAAREMNSLSFHRKQILASPTLEAQSTLNF